MGFREGAWATIWEITDERDNFAKVRMSTSRKDKKTDEYVTDFSGFVSLVGEAFKRLDEIAAEIENSERCRIRLGACDVTNRYDKEREREYVNFTLFGFKFPDEDENESDGEKKTSSKKPAKKQAAKSTGKKKPAPPPIEDEDGDGDGDDENLPF